jgi:hypothetical protein
MPQPGCDICGKRVAPDERVTTPTELDDTGRVLRPAVSWHKECLRDGEDARGDAEEGLYPGHEEDPGWTPH